VSVELLSIGQAVTRLGVSEVTIRRRLRKGELNGHKRQTPQGYVWMIELPDDVSEDNKNDGNEEGESLSELVAALRAQVEGQQELVDSLQAQVKAQQEELTAKNKQIEQLHILLQQAQAALPAPRDNRSWWQLWKR
jgi:multidrug efflux pump subunit AcrA (membrane-fusion protein)